MVIGLTIGQAYLLKVPKFVAKEWRQMEDGNLLATLQMEGREIKGITMSVNGEQRVLLCKANEISRANSFLCSESDPHSVEFAKIAASYTLVPPLDDRYRKELKQRHLKDNIKRDRYVTEETRPDPPFDSIQTLFKFYNPKTGIQVLDSGLQEAPFDRSKNRFRKQENLDYDTIKMKIFKLFESDAAANGLQLKQIAMSIGQSMLTTKVLVEDVAQLKRSKDRKMLYFLKDQFNPAVTLANETPFGDKPINFN
ncbi:conserved Plasmodium protein, unknown function [Babesia microti strain RI]|uniref:Transcription initiation factor IIF subunit beta n=1 Tax=Babesia microti (strain RI) TaxID=1133968 RepID=A0A1N6LW79_BABMR|nr:conserved Plasmodium protein, unknown function [Babesia microti strain RI]SIO73130.1 conserved Plasmodium protein, unknown function [Babesia microti strain RI]|eukprot:XP_021337242.1 conserved Plasmodium protein, unknown function [Babesia microti strain RI]